MSITDKKRVLQNICYTELVYDRINKKLNLNLLRTEIEELIYKILNETDESLFTRRGKNFYISNAKYNIRITVNSNTFRVITADIIKKRSSVTHHT